MGWDSTITGITTRTTGDTIPPADINTTDDNVGKLWGDIQVITGNGTSAPSKNMTQLAAGGNETTTTIGSLINGATAKTSAVDADMLPLMDSESSNVVKKLSWSYVKSILKTYFDSVSTTLTNKTLTAPLFQGAIDGWILADETWTYASASTFTVSGDVTGKYPIGAKIKWTQTTVKYGTISATSYGAPNTTITIVVNTDYTIANAAISANYYSLASNPVGFPHWFNYTPTITSTGGSPTTITIGFSEYSVVARTVFVHAKFTVTDKGTATGNMVVTLPVNCVTAAHGGGSGIESANTGKTISAPISTTGAYHIIMYDGTTPFVDTYVLWVQTRYEI